MSNVVVVGAQWGDEGKGKVVDLLTRHAEIVVRFLVGARDEPYHVPVLISPFGYATYKGS